MKYKKIHILMILLIFTFLQTKTIVPIISAIICGAGFGFIANETSKYKNKKLNQDIKCQDYMLNIFGGAFYVFGSLSIIETMIRYINAFKERHQIKKYLKKHSELKKSIKL